MQKKSQQPGNSFNWKTIYQRIFRTHTEPFWKIFADWQFVVVLVLLLVFTDWLGKRWVFEPATLGSTDVLVRERKPQAAKHCTLITIDENEFSVQLGEWLQPDRLSLVLDNIQQYEPKVIVVDIDTSAPRFATLKVPMGKSKIVWARVAYETLRTNSHDGMRWLEWQAGGVLGGRTDLQLLSGSPLFPQDSDSTVRGFQRMVKINASVPALYWAALKALGESGITDEYLDDPMKKLTNEEEQEFHPLLTNWTFRTVPLTDLMSKGGNLLPHAGELGDIVLLGANFSDIHPTPFGPKLGIELTASAIESELSNHPIRSYEWEHWAVKIVLAFAIVWLNHRLLPLWATAGTLALLTLVFLASFVSIYYGMHRMDFLPFMVGIWIEQLIEISQRAHRTEH